MTRIIRIFLQLAAIWLIIPNTAFALNSICTIQPVCLLVDAVIGEKIKSTQLLPDNADLHHYSFRPSDLRKLSQADIVVRVSPDLERFINPLLDHQRQTIITLSETAGLIRLPIPKKHQHAHKDSEHQQHKEHTEHSIISLDPHFWLNPKNAIKMAHHLAKQLSVINPAQTKHYQKNSQALIKRIQQSDKRITQLLHADKQQAYLAFHAGLQYFDQYYGLEAPEIISMHEGLAVGIKTMRHLRAIIKQTKIRCLIIEPRTSPAFIRTLTEDVDINISTIDPVGSTHAKTFHHYTDLLEYIAQSRHNCLKILKNK